MKGFNAKKFAALRQLAAFGLPGRAVVAEVVDCLMDIAGFESASLIYLDETLQPCDVFVTHDVRPEVVGRYIERWFNRDEARFYPAQARMQTDPSVGLIRVSDYSGPMGRTEIYDEVFKHDRHHWIAGIAIRDGTRALGNLGIGRPPSASDFSDREMQILAMARPFVTQALSRWESGDDPAEAGHVHAETAMIVSDMSGCVQHATSNGWRLLRQAANVPAGREMLGDGTYQWARPFLASLARRVEASLAGREAAPAAITIHSSYGCFLLRAYTLDIGLSDGRNLISVQIERHVPLALQLIASNSFRGLSLREREVCRLMVSGLSHADVAAALGVKPSTAITHTRNLYAKLGVHDRDGLIRALLPDER